MKIVKTKRICDNEYQNLRELLILLMGNYDQLSQFENKILMFQNVCNKYLSGKQFVYNQSDITLKVVSDEEKILPLSNLSSGEKKIVSLFSKLYLENEGDCILIIDEPELSISIEWQRMLIPDIMRSGNCRLFLTVTHSPFIFENEFDMDTKDMTLCLTKYEKGVD